MHLSLLGCFDLGLSFGIDDHPFRDQARVEEFNRRSGLTAQFPAPDSPLGLASPIGTGLRIDLNKHSLLRVWVEKAQAINDTGDSELSNEWWPAPDTDLKERARELFTRCQSPTCYADVYSLGVMFLRLDCNGLPAEPPPALVRFFQSLEYAAYRFVAPHLKQIAQDMLAVFCNRNRFEEASRRANLDQVEPFDLIEGFVCVLRCDGVGQNQQAIAELQKYERQRPFTRLDLDEAVVSLGYAACVLETRTQDFPRVYWLLQSALVFLQISRSFDSLFARYMAETLRSRLVDQEVVQDARFLSDLRTLAATVVELTNFAATTNNTSDLHLFTAFDRINKVSDRHARIRSTSEVFYTVQSELTRIEDKRRETWLNRILFLLTSLTTISVMADILNTIVIKEEFAPGPFSVRTLLLALPLLVILGVLLLIYLVWPGMKYCWRRWSGG
jgi:hypothetical protein